MERSAPGLRLLRLESAAASAVALTCGLCVCWWVWMVVRFVCVICVPLCALVSRVCPVCPGSPGVFLPVTVYGYARRASVQFSKRSRSHRDAARSLVVQACVKTPEKCLLACRTNSTNETTGTVPSSRHGEVLWEREAAVLGLLAGRPLLSRPRGAVGSGPAAVESAAVSAVALTCGWCVGEFGWS